jgi:hypothetical protein
VFALLWCLPVFCSASHTHNRVNLTHKTAYLLCLLNKTLARILNGLNLITQILLNISGGVGSNDVIY